MLQLYSVLSLPAFTQSTIYCATIIHGILLFSARLAKCNCHVNQIHLPSSSISSAIVYCELAKLSVFESPFQHTQ